MNPFIPISIGRLEPSNRMIMTPVRTGYATAGGEVTSRLIDYYARWEDEHGSGASGSCVACNPAGQAVVLNSLNTDINIMVGLCMGVDCLFAQTSRATMSTLLVKDKSLVNTPIGAIYSDHFLNEVTQSPAPENV